MHFSTVILAALAATPIAFAEEKKYGDYEFSKSAKSTGSVRPIARPSGKPFPGTGTHPKPTFKPFPTGGFPKPSGHPKPTVIASELGPEYSALPEVPVTFTKYATVDGNSGESEGEFDTINIEETPKSEVGKPLYGKPSGKPYFPAQSGKPHPSGGKPTFKPLPTGHRPITHHPFPTASGKPRPTASGKPRPTPVVSELEPIVSTATVIPLPVETETEVESEPEYKLKARKPHAKRFNLNPREDEEDTEDEDEVEPIEDESPPIVATSTKGPKGPKPTKSGKTGHGKPTGKPEHSIKPFPHPTGGYAHPSGRPHPGHGGPSGFVTSKKVKTLTATKTGGKGKPTPIPVDE